MRTKLHAALVVFLGSLTGVGAQAPGAAPVAGTTATSRNETPQATRPIDGIRDNSFLIEEAYNQEPGVVQHIFTAQFGAEHQGAADDRMWDVSFTQEWPFFSQEHQLSFTVPYAFLDEDAENASGLGDVLLNYRYQPSQDEPGSAAFAPRFSLILPSGDEERGFGVGTTGYQVNLPISKTLTERMYVNFNAGVTYYPNADLRLSDGRDDGKYDLLGFNLGGSVIYAVSDTFHLLVEAVWNSEDTLEERVSLGDRWVFADRTRLDEVVLSPGVRWAMNLNHNLQIVPGLAFPIGLSDDAADYGVFLYLSIEHPFVKAR